MSLEIVFLCGMPRSASTWLGRTLSSHPEVAVFGETDYWSRSFIKPNTLGQYKVEHVDKVATQILGKTWSKTTGDENGEICEMTDFRYRDLVSKVIESISLPTTPGELYIAIATFIAREQRVETIVDKTPGHLLFLDRIKSGISGCRFIILSREPLGFVTSLTHRKEGKGWLDIPLLRQLAYHPALTVTLWRRYAQGILSARNSVGTECLFVDYQEIIDDSTGVLEKVCEYIGVTADLLEVDNQPINSSFKGVPRAGPPKATTYWLKLLARDEFENLYPHLALTNCRRSDVVVSWLLLLPGLLAFILYAPKPTNFTGYFANIVRFRSKSKETSR